MSYLPSILISPGNITPNKWYQQFTNQRGTPDLALISVLSEIVYWYRPKKSKDPDTGSITYVNKFLGDAWQTSYEYFKKKFGFNREKLRKIFVKLEQMGICSREFRNVTLRGQTYNNRLFIHLSSEFLDSCTTQKEKDQESYNTDCNTSFFSTEEEGASPHLEGKHIIDIKNKNIIKDRSTKSNFCKISSEENSIRQKSSQSVLNEHQDVCTKKSPVAKTKIKSIFAKNKELKDFYPLTKEDCQSLQSSSNREFSLNAMNEILLDMSKRLTDRVFSSKKAFLSYMSKAFAYEMRDAVKTGNENFKIKNNKTQEEVELEKKEKYLTEIEYNLQVSPEWHLKKKLACVFDTHKSYALLNAYRSIEQEGSVFILYLDKHVELTKADKRIIFNQVKATHDIIDLNQNQITMIKSLEIKMSKKSAFDNRASSVQNDRTITQNIVIPDTIWGRVRKSLIAIYGEATDRNWFSKLDAQMIEDSRAIHLKSPTSFIKDWIKTHYFETIEKFGMMEEYSVVMI